MEPLTRPHLDDGELLALLDGEADDAERVDLETHLAACAECRARMERYRLRRDRLATLLAGADFDIPASTSLTSAPTSTVDVANEAEAPDRKVIPLRPRAAEPRRFVDRPWLRAAAVVVLLAAAAAIATPARAWIIAFVSRRWSHITQQPQTPSPRTTPAPPVQRPPEPVQASAQVRFVPAGAELRVEVAHAQAAGSLTLVSVDGTAASGEVVGVQAVEMLVVPSGLRIRNTAAATADYRVQVPEAVRRVRVRIGGREIVVERIDLGGAGKTISLARG